MRTCASTGCDRPVRARGWCAAHYGKWKRGGDADQPLRHYARSPDESFEARTIPRAGHLIWTGAKARGGYGHLRVGDAMRMAHRFAWERENGAIPDGMFVDHICRVPECVEVSHLRLATVAQNTQYQDGPHEGRKYDLPRGVRKNGSGYQAHVTRGETARYKTFPTVEQAARQAEAWRAELFGSFAGR